MNNSSENNNKLIKWIRKIGFWGFLFFLVKGLVWLAVAWWIAKK
ncbi:MAG TPA: hypothetical protein VJ647_03425 [Chitinophagaceae bacterium]|nr:hypothetical protein [Chitinophagaceae bacterium]